MNFRSANDDQLRHNKPVVASLLAHACNHDRCLLFLQIKLILHFPATLLETLQIILVNANTLTCPAPTAPAQKNNHLSLHSPLFLPFPHLGRPLLLQKLLLLLRLHSLEPRLPLRPLVLFHLQPPLLCLLAVVHLLDQFDLLLTGRANATHDLGAEVRGAGEEVGEAQELGEDGNGGGERRGGGAGGEAGEEGDALFGGGFVESVVKGSWIRLGGFVVGLECMRGLTSEACQRVGRR